MKHVILKIILIFGLGAFASLSMAPSNFWPALFVGLSGLYVCITRANTVGKSAWIGLLFGLGYFGFSLSWIGNALLVEGNPYWWAWPLAVSGLPLVLSLFTAVFCALYTRIFKNRTDILAYLSFVFSLFLSELARGHLFTGFPWNLYGYTWIDTPIAQMASLYNIYFLTLFTIFWACVPAFIATSMQRKRYKIIFVTLAAFSFIGGYGFGVSKIQSLHSENSAYNSFVIVQPNIKQSEKWKAENQHHNFKTLLELSYFIPSSVSTNSSENVNGTPDATFIIWPETAISMNILNSSWAMNQIRLMLATYDTPAYLITGALRYEKEKSAYFNSVIVINKNVEIINTYNKSHLVPFGEYMPLSGIVDIAPIVGFEGFEAGPPPDVLNIADSLRFVPLICYEIVFPHMANRARGLASDVIINVTNDAWYGHSSGPYQHLVKARFRAIETGKHVIRSANTGISALILPTGRVAASLDLETRGRIVIDVLVRNKVYALNYMLEL